MFHKLLFILFLNNSILFVVGYSECDEYIIIVKEYNCSTSLVPIVKPITLNDIDASCFNSKNLSSYDETNINESYVIKFDYNNSESICVPVMKTMDLLSNITIPDDDPLPANITHESMQVEDTGKVKDINITVTDINLFYINEVNSDPKINNNKNCSNHLLQCVYTDNICLNENSVEYNNTVDGDDSITHNVNTNTIIAVIKNGVITKPTTSIVNYFNNFTDFNCTIGDTKTISDNQIIAITYDLIKKYTCKNKTVDKLNNATSALLRYNLTVNAATDFILTNEKIQYTDCGNFDSVSNTTFTILCNTNNITGATDNNVTVDNVNVTNKELNMSMIWHCELVNLNYNTENILKFKDLKLFAFQNCTEDYRNINKSNDVESSVIILKKDNITDTSQNHSLLEHNGIFNSNPLQIQLVSSNNSDAAAILNITKGRIFNLLTTEGEKVIRNHSSFVELKLPNCVNNDTKLNQNGDPLELDIIFNSENTNPSEPLIKNIIYTSVNFTKRAILNCMYSCSTANISSPRNETNSIFNCEIIDQDNYKNASVLKNELNVTNNNLEDNVTSTTEKIDREPSTTITSKTNDKDKIINNTSTTETNLLGYSLGMGNYSGKNYSYDVRDDPSYISPNVIITIVASIIGVVASVGTYAYFIFRRPKHKYEPAAARDWGAMDDTAF